MSTMGFRPYPGPDATKIVYVPEVVSATFSQGDLVIITSGFCVIATDDQEVFGIALADKTGTTSNPTPVYVITPGDKFIAEANGTTALTNVGVAYEAIMTAGSMSVDVGTTSNPTFYIEKLDPRDGATTGAGGRVIGRFLYASSDAIGG